MSSPSIPFLVTIHGLALGGFTSNAFIIAVIVTELATTRSLNSSELFLLCLSVSNICSVASLIAAVYSTYFRFVFWSSLMFRVISIFISISVLSRFWFTAWLCVFYCVRIVNSTHTLFLWCKQRISWLVPRILAASAVISIICPFFAFRLVPVHLQDNTSTVNITNMAQVEEEGKLILSYEIFFVTIGSSCPLLVVFLSSTMIVASLYRHVSQMRGKESSFRNSQTEAHFKAAGTVLFLLFLYLSFYIVQMLAIITTTETKTMISYLYFVVLIGYSFAQAAILVLVNPKLKQALTQMFPERKP